MDKDTERVEQSVANLLSRLLNRRWADRLMVVASLLILGIIVALLIWVCWFWAIRELVGWGFEFEEFRWYQSWKPVLAALAILYMAIMPFIVVPMFPRMVNFWNTYFDRGGALAKQVDEARQAQDEIEKQLAESDPHKMIALVSYSRQMLSEYYAIGMSQAQRSFKYSLIAMWLGFLVLLSGVALHYADLQNFAVPGVKADIGDADQLVLLTGAIIEFIAAAFLWVYRTSIQQLTYFYSRQFKLHTSLLAHRIASDAEEIKGEAIKVIVDRLLQEDPRPNPKGPTSEGIRKLLERKPAD